METSDNIDINNIVEPIMRADGASSSSNRALSKRHRQQQLKMKMQDQGAASPPPQGLFLHDSKRLKTAFNSTPPLPAPLFNSQPAIHVEVDPLDLRWRILKQLLPRGSELQAEKDDLLKVVFEYVQDLETEIKTFKHEGSINTDGASEEEMGALQKKGLCIVPLSKLTTAF